MLVVLVLVATSVFGQFRDTTWGMTALEVINAEGRDPTDRIASEDVKDGWRYILVYAIDMFGSRGEARYRISDNDTLDRAEYWVPSTAVGRIYEGLIRRYGPSLAYPGDREKGRWRPSEYTIIEYLWDSDLQIGRVVYRQPWRFERGRIQSIEEFPL